MDKSEFLAEYNISEADLQAAEVSWEELVLLAPGEISHSGPGEKNQFQPDKNSQRPRLAC